MVSSVMSTLESRSKYNNSQESKISSLSSKKRSPVILEFDSGFDPPLGRPEASYDNDDDGYDDGNDHDHHTAIYNEQNDEDTASLSIADLTNIDESILISDRRRRSRSLAGSRHSRSRAESR